MRQRWSLRRIAVAIVVALIVVGTTVVAVRLVRAPACGAEQVADPVTPLQSAAIMRERPNKDRDLTVAALNAMGAPFGTVDAGVDYYYEQWLRLYGVAGGVLAWTKNNAPVIYLDDKTLAPRWSLRPTAKRTAWDASNEKFLLLNLSESDPVTIAEFDLRTGRAGWCIEVAARHRPGQPVATAFLDSGDVLAALPSGSGVQVTRLSGDRGESRWSREIDQVGRADYLGPLNDELLLIGGVEESRLTDPSADNSAGSGVAGVEIETGTTRWEWAGDPGEVVHVVGVADGRPVLLVRNAQGLDLVGVTDTGQESWRKALPNGAREATLRGEVVILRSTAGLQGYDAGLGDVLWKRAIPQDRPYIPLGFRLGQMPSVDAEHLLLPTVSSLELLDVTDGSSQSYPMPTDGLSSAYFPYQLLATQHHLGVITNTGAVLALRE